VQTTRHPGWLIGCTLVKPLHAADLHALLKARLNH
jgi:hypothetical protein